MKVTDKKLIVHISEVELSLETGMGRVGHYWQKGFEDAGYEFLHIGPKAVGKVRHMGLFPSQAYNYYKKLNLKPLALIVHEPACGPFAKKGVPCFLESHGVERRAWEAVLNGTIPTTKPSLKTRILYPFWRLYNCDIGLRRADKLLLINSDDQKFVTRKYARSEKDIFIFKNGINLFENIVEKEPTEFTILFNASWIERKGIFVLVDAAILLYKQNIRPRFILFGTGKNEESVLEDWPVYLRDYVTVIPYFPQSQEVGLYNKGSVLILPSYFEGQPLSLLQAMAAGKCCITTNCCGQKDMIKNGKTGFLFEPGHPNELTQLIIRCIDNPKLVEEIGANAKIAIRELSWENVSAQLVNYVLKSV